MRNVLIAVLFGFLSFGAFGATQPSAKELRFRALARAHVEQELDAGHTLDIGLRALDALTSTAHARIRAQGDDELATSLEAEWKAMRKGFAGESYDLGDHAALSAKVADWYAKVEAKLGVTLCEFLHLRDIFTINYAWPVVMHPHADEQWCSETLAAEPLDTCRQEYLRHGAGTKYQKNDDPYAKPHKTFGLFPVSAYWVTFIACEIGLYGSDGTFLCGPAATAVEIGTARFIAPPVAGKIWDRNNP
jgi:hypothetical protein